MIARSLKMFFFFQNRKKTTSSSLIVCAEIETSLYTESVVCSRGNIMTFLTVQKRTPAGGGGARYS